MDLKTLWDRANDAINTIIRLDETTETGVFLQPCIEGTHLVSLPIVELNILRIWLCKSINYSSIWVSM